MGLFGRDGQTLYLPPSASTTSPSLFSGSQMSHLRVSLYISLFLSLTRATS